MSGIRWIIGGTWLMVTMMLLVVIALVFNNVYFKSDSGLKDIVDGVASGTLEDASLNKYNQRSDDQYWFFNFFIVVVAGVIWMIALVYMLSKQERYVE